MDFQEIDEMTPTDCNIALTDGRSTVVGVYRPATPVRVANATLTQLPRMGWNDALHRWEIPGGVFVAGQRHPIGPTHWSPCAE